MHTKQTDFKELVKSSIDIVDYIGKDVSLHKKNFDDYRGTVGTRGKTGASLIVTPSTQLWNDTKNGKGGDIFSWIAYHEGLDDHSDFPGILRIAAGFAGLEMEGLTDDDRAFIEEGKAVTATLNEVTEIYHQNLLRNPDAIQQVKEDWNFGLDVIKAFKMGYATGEDLKHIENKKLVKAGLKYKNSNKELFVDRIMFPYLIRDNTVYFIGKKTQLTPTENDGRIAGKYKKLLTHDNNPDVSQHVNNKFLFGEDTIRKSDYILIAEGVSDAVSAVSRGYPTVSAVATHIKSSEIDRVSKIIGTRPVKICLDIDTGGIKGAREMTEKLTLKGNDVSIITLTDSEGKSDFDLNDYFRTHTTEDFDIILENAVGYWNYILNAKECKSLPILTRLNKLNNFISADLRHMPEDLWRPFIESDVLLAFGLSKREARSTLDVCEKNKCGDKAEDKGTETTNAERLKVYSTHVINRANGILDTGDPFEFIMDVWNTLHVGDRNIGENLLCSVGGTQITNTKLGLHQKPSGATGTGKSDAIKHMLKLLPAFKYIEGSISSKVMFYDNTIVPGTIVYTDDAKIEGDIVTTLRAATSDYQEDTIHRTLDGDRKVSTFIIPKRVTFWMSMVNSIPDEQLQNRFFFGDTDESSAQDENVNKHQIKRITEPYSIEQDIDVLTCRCIFDIICSTEYAVYSPLAAAISWNDKEHRRNFDKFLDLLQSVTLFKFKQRDLAFGGIVSSLDDYDRALRIFNGTSASNSTNLNGKELLIMKVIQESPGRTILFTEIQDKTGFKETSLRNVIDGRNGGEGLLGKVKGLYKLDKSESVSCDNGSTRSTTKGNVYKYTGTMFEHGSKLFQSVATIDREKATTLACEFIASDTENGPNPRNPRNGLATNARIKNDNSKDNNNNNKYTILADVAGEIDSIYSPVENLENNEIKKEKNTLPWFWIIARIGVFYVSR